MAVTLQEILNTAFPAYAATHRLPLRVHKAVSVLRRCRTGGLGRNAVKCTGGHVLAVRRTPADTAPARSAAGNTPNAGSRAGRPACSQSRTST